MIDQGSADLSSLDKRFRGWLTKKDCKNFHFEISKIQLSEFCDFFGGELAL